jgi:formate hydrogenlyase subunit 3/multisubunit Na+/H+ antiporter MnhD subunit
MAAFYGVIVGLPQDNPKTVLAYSSISQMGFMTVGVGVGLSVPAVWPATLAALSLYALHHGVAKGALFLGVGVAQGSRQEGWERWLILLGLLLPALALAGAPCTSGGAAKLALKTVISASSKPWSEWVNGLLPFATVGTTLLMGRFLFLLRPASHRHGPQLTPMLWMPWAALLSGVLLLSWFFVSDSLGKILMKTLSVSTLWPVIVGSLLSWAAWQWQGLSKKVAVRIPPGDLLVGVDWLWERRPRRRRSLTKALGEIPQLSQSWQKIRQQWLSARFLSSWEGWFSAWTSAGLMFLALLAATFSLLALG